MPGPHPHALEDRYRRAARRLFGARADNYAVSEELVAMLLGKNLVETEGREPAEAALIACDVFPDANRAEVQALLEGSGAYRPQDQRKEL